MNAATISTTGNKAMAWHAIAANDVVRLPSKTTDSTSVSGSGLRDSGAAGNRWRRSEENVKP
jgi:hypothetical protein